MGPLETPRGRRKSSKRSGEARKTAGKPPMGPRTPRWTHAARPPGGVSCHPASKTAQPPLPRKEKPAKRYEHLAGFHSDALNPLRTQHVYWARKESRAQSTVACKFILDRTSKTPLRHGITAFSLNRKALAGPPLFPGQWAHGEAGWWPFRGIDHARFLVSKQ